MGSFCTDQVYRLFGEEKHMEGPETSHPLVAAAAAAAVLSIETRCTRANHNHAVGYFATLYPFFVGSFQEKGGGAPSFARARQSLAPPLFLGNFRRKRGA